MGWLAGRTGNGMYPTRFPATLFALLIAAAFCAAPVAAKNATEWFSIGDALLSDREYQDALDAYTNGLYVDGGNASAWSSKGYVLTSLGRYADALDAVDRSLALDPDNPVAWNVKGFALERLNKFGDALAAYNRSLALDPKGITVWNNKGSALINLGRYEEALVAFDKALALAPSYTVPRINKAGALAGLGRNEEALAICMQVYSMAPGTMASVIREREGEFNNLHTNVASLETCNRTLSTTPTNIIGWINQSTLLSSVGRYQEALDAADKALGHDPANQPAWMSRSEALLGLKKYDEALEGFDRVISGDKKNAVAWARKGDALKGLGRRQEALAAYNTSLANDPGNYWTLLARNNLLLDTRMTAVPSPTPARTGTSSSAAQPYPLPAVIAIAVVLVVGGGGYVLYRMRRKPAATPPPAGESVPSPLPSAPPRPPAGLPAAGELPPEFAGRYVASAFIGKGGFARVYRAQRTDGTFVAVKIPLAKDPSIGKTFVAELQNWTRLDHPNIVRVLDYNILPIPFFEMELCESSLAALKKPVAPEEAARIVFEVCEGLKYAHARSIVHRDLKPQNILLLDGVPKISDWGLSRVLSESAPSAAATFTPSYAAPEQVNDRPRNERTDIWQLGVILYELVTGELPFRGESVVEVVVNISTRNPRPPHEITLDAAPLEPVILRCLEKDPARRYQSVAELQKALARSLSDQYAGLLAVSVTVGDLDRSASYCGELVLMHLRNGDLSAAYTYSSDLVSYARGEVREEAEELARQIRMRMETGMPEIPDELLDRAGRIARRMRGGRR